MALITNKPGMSDENTKKYYEINQKILEKRMELENLQPYEHEKRKEIEDEINQLLMEQVLLTSPIQF